MKTYWLVVGTLACIPMEEAVNTQQDKFSHLFKSSAPASGLEGRPKTDCQKQPQTQK